VLAVQGISKSYDNEKVLDRVDLSVDAGEIVALLGPNGAGKTTLLSIVAGLRQADEGHVVIGGHDLANERAQAISKLAIAPQDTGVQLLLTARQNLEFYARLAGLSRTDVASQIDLVADGLELGPFLDKTTSHLSGGQRRRVHAGCAIVARPQVLLLDEPTVGADLEMRGQLLGVVRDVCAQGTAVVYTTHYLPEVEALDARVVMLERGSVLIDTPLATLLDDHASSFVELTFAGDAPSIAVPGLEVTYEGTLLRAEGPGVAARTAELITALGEEAPRLRGVEVLQPNLETAYLALTGQRFAIDGSDRSPEENSDVVDEVA
jgi:ABC-2 type transport system ATP-binding protein